MMQLIKKNSFIKPVVLVCLCVIFIMAFGGCGQASLLGVSVKGNDEELRNEQNCHFLAQATESLFMEVDGIEAADAVVSYDKDSGQSFCALSLTTEAEISEEEIQKYKEILNKTYDQNVLIINGEHR